MGGDHGNIVDHVHVQREGDPVRPELMQECGDQLGRFHRQAADHDPARAAIKQPRHLVALADAAGHLEVERGGGGEFGKKVMLAGGSGARAVEVDDVRPSGSGCGEFLQGVGGSRRIGSDLVELALGEADDAAAHQVDGGIDDHALRNASRKRRPGAALFSGWNCAPHKLRWRIAAGSARP
jgi:hypothetical protein